MLIDDTVILATSRENLLKTLDTLRLIAVNMSWDVNGSKTMFLVLTANGHWFLYYPVV